MGKKILAHDFNLNLHMYKLLIDKSLKKKLIKFNIRDLKTIKQKDLANVKVFWGNRLKLKDLEKMPNLEYIHFGKKGIEKELKEKIIQRKIRYTLTKKIFVKPIVATILGYIFGIARGLDVSNELRKEKNLID